MITEQEQIFVMDKVMGLQEQCDKFNAKYKKGTKGWLHLDSGERKPTHTTSEAQVLSGHTAVVWCHGISDCYLLDRFEPV